MTKKTTFELDDILLTQESSAIVAIEQNGAAFKASVRPNPPFQINVSSQAQLEAKFGSDIEIPDGDSVTIVVDESFVLTKPIKYGVASSLEFYGSTIRINITYVGAGRMFQPITPGDIGTSMYIHDIILQSSGGNDLLDAKLTNSCRLRDVQILQFNGIGEIDCPVIDMRIQLGAVLTTGLIIRNPGTVVIDSYLLRQLAGATGITLFSFIFGANTPFIELNSVIADFFAGDSIVFIDSNVPVNASIVVKESNQGLGNLYQQGTDIAATANAIGTNPDDTQFDIIGHNLLVGRVVTLKDFTGFVGYNKTAIVTAVNDANSVDIAVGFLGIDSSGTMSAKSLDNISVEVLSQGNPGVPDSMFTGNAGLEIVAPITVTINTANVPEVITNVNWNLNNLERFADDVATPNQGRLVCKEKTTRKYSITYSGTIERGGGGGTNYGIVLLKQVGGAGPLVNVSINSPRVFTTSITPLTRTEIIELSENDVVQVGVINFVNINDIDVYQANLEVNRA